MRESEIVLRKLIRETARHLFESEFETAADRLARVGKSGQTLSGASTYADAAMQIKGRGAFMQRQKGPEGEVQDVSLGKRIQLGPAQVTYYVVIPGSGGLRRKIKERLVDSKLRNKPLSWLLGYMFSKGANGVGSQDGKDNNPSFEYIPSEHLSYGYYTPDGFIQVDNVSSDTRAKIYNMFRNAQMNNTQVDYVNFYADVESGNIDLGSIETGLVPAPSSSVTDPGSVAPSTVRKILTDEQQARVDRTVRILSKKPVNEQEFYKRLIKKISAELEKIHPNSPEESRRAPLDPKKNIDTNILRREIKDLQTWSPEEFLDLRDKFVGSRV